MTKNLNSQFELKLRNNWFKPDLFTDLNLLNPKDLRKIGIRGIIFDFDNTLIGNKADEISTTRADILAAWIKEYGRNNIAIVSNKLPIFGWANALYEQGERFRIKAIATGPLFKPFPQSLKKAIAQMKLKPHQVAIVGDLLSTDIAGGKLAGMMTILVRPVRSQERRLIRLIRWLERLILITE